MKSRIPKLTVGKSYFTCGYYLRHLPIPVIEAYVYVGRNLHGESEDQTHHYFESPQTYYAEQLAKERLEYVGEEPDDPELEPRLRISEKDVEALVYDYAGLSEFVSSLGEDPNAGSVFETSEA